MGSIHPSSQLTLIRDNYSQTSSSESSYDLPPLTSIKAKQPLRVEGPLTPPLATSPVKILARALEKQTIKTMSSDNKLKSDKLLMWNEKIQSVRASFEHMNKENGLALVRRSHIEKRMPNSYWSIKSPYRKCVTESIKQITLDSNVLCETRKNTESSTVSSDNKRQSDELLIENDESARVEMSVEDLDKENVPPVARQSDHERRSLSSHQSHWAEFHALSDQAYLLSELKKHIEAPEPNQPLMEKFPRSRPLVCPRCHRWACYNIQSLKSHMTTVHGVMASRQVSPSEEDDTAE